MDMMVAWPMNAEKDPAKEKQKVWAPDPMKKGGGAAYGGRGYDDDSTFSQTWRSRS